MRHGEEKAPNLHACAGSTKRLAGLEMRAFTCRIGSGQMTGQRCLLSLEIAVVQGHLAWPPPVCGAGVLLAAAKAGERERVSRHYQLLTGPESTFLAPPASSGCRPLCRGFSAPPRSHYPGKRTPHSSGKPRAAVRGSMPRSGEPVEGRLQEFPQMNISGIKPPAQAVGIGIWRHLNSHARMSQLHPLLSMMVHDPSEPSGAARHKHPLSDLA